jgi:RNA polymerase sigma-70 factor, ECF subfamily
LSQENSMSEDIGKRDRTALEGMLTLSMPQLYRAAARLLRNQEDSEDALQEAMLSALLHLHQFEGRSQLSTWMHSIVFNAARNQLRKRNRRHQTPIAEDIVDDDDGQQDREVLVDSRPNPEEECTRQEQSRILKRRLNLLPLKYRSVIQLCILDDLPRTETAQKLGVSVSLVKTRLHRACALLAKQK